VFALVSVHDLGVCYVRLLEVRLREFGVSGFEVTDNGSGIAADNYAGLTAKYHTSKLNTFEDLASVIS